MKNRVVNILFILLFCSVIHPCLGQSSDKLVYIVSPDIRGLEKGTNNELFKTILQGKIEEYALNSEYQAVARDEALNHIQNEIRVQQSGGVSAESIVKLGQWTGANYILLSSVVGSNGYGTIKLNLYATETGSLIKVKSTSFQEDISDYSQKADRVCKEFFGIASSSSQSAEENPTATIPQFNKQISIPNINFYIASEDEPGFFTWENAKLACESKGAGWRLPTIKELEIMNFQKNRIRNLYGYKGKWGYWSSQEKNKRSAYYYDFMEAEEDDDDKSDADKCVRCVRSR